MVNCLQTLTNCLRYQIPEKLLSMQMGMLT